MSQALLSRYRCTRSYEDFNTLVRETLPHVYRVSYRVTRDRHLAEDSTQEVFLRVLSADSPQERSAAPIVRSLTNSAISVSRTRLRSRRRRVARERAVVRDPDAVHGSSDVSRDERLDLEDALKTLSVQHRRCVDLVYYGGLSYRDAAAELGIAMNTVRARIAEAITLLRRRLAPVTAGVVLPVLLGEVSAWAEPIRVSVAFAARLQELRSQARALDPATASGSAGATSTSGSAAGRVVGETGARKVALWGGAAAVAVILSIGALWRLSSGSEVGIVEADTEPTELALAAPAPPPVALKALNVDAEPAATSEERSPQSGYYPLALIVQLVVDSYQMVELPDDRPRRFAAYDRDSKEPATVAIQVLDVDGHRVHGARVGIERPASKEYDEDGVAVQGPPPAPQYEDWRSVGPDGIAVFENIPKELYGSTFHGVAEAEGYLSSKVGDFAPYPGPPTTLYVTLRKEVRSTLVVTDASTGNPIAGAKLWYGEPTQNRFACPVTTPVGSRPGDLVGETDARGEMPLARFSSDAYCVRVVAPGYERWWSGSLRLPERLEVELQPDPRPWTASLLIELYDFEDKPFENLPLRVDLDRFGPIIRGTTDARGLCLLEGLPAGTHTVDVDWYAVRLLGESVERRLIRWDPPPTDITLEEGTREELLLRRPPLTPRERDPSTWIHVIVRDDRGRPRSDVPVTFGMVSKETDATGCTTFEVQGIQGSTLRLVDGETTWSTLSYVEADKLNETVTAEIQLGYARIRGRVECVEMRIPERMPVEIRGALETEIETKDGTFALTGACPGVYVLSVAHGVLFGETTVTVPSEGDPPEAVICLKSRTTVVVRLLAADGTFVGAGCEVTAEHLKTGETYELTRAWETSGPEYRAERVLLGELRLFIQQPGHPEIVETFEVLPRNVMRLTGTLQGGRVVLMDDG